MVYYLGENEPEYLSIVFIWAPVVLRYISSPEHPLWETFSFSIARVADRRRQSWNTSGIWWGEGSKDDGTMTMMVLMMITQRWTPKKELVTGYWLGNRWRDATFYCRQPMKTQRTRMETLVIRNVRVLCFHILLSLMSFCWVVGRAAKTSSSLPSAWGFEGATLHQTRKHPIEI